MGKSFITALSLIGMVALQSHLWGYDDSADHSHASPNTPAVRPEVAWKPTAIPDRIVLTWEGDPATSQSVTWRTDTTVEQAVAEIAPAEDGPKFVANVSRVAGQTQSLTSNLGQSLRHSVRFTNLEPDTMYSYRVGDGTNWSEWADFKTADDKASAFSFVYFGDAQNYIKSHWSRVVRRAYRDAPRAAFFVHAGDLVNTAESDAEWGEWFYAGGFIHRSTPCVATPGNHEMGSDPETGKKRLSIHWRTSFAFPLNGPEGLEESAYYFDYQGARIVSLNSSQQQAEQVEWLDKVLSESPAQWNILTFHHPLYSSGKGRDNKTLRDLWQPIIDKHGVDLVLQGHDHTYARTRQVTAEVNVDTGLTYREKTSGTVYVVSVSGPKMYELQNREIVRRAAEDTQLFQVISIDGAQLTFEARTATGRLYDSFILRKHADSPNQLIEQIPRTLENRRIRDGN